MNSNNYQLTRNNTELNKKADDLMQIITFLSNERVYNRRFPEHSTIEYNELDEEELIEAIEDLEKIYKQVGTHYHHRSHLYVLTYNRVNDLYRVYHNPDYGTDPITDPPITGGKTAMDALVNAWDTWSIPPVLILNSKYYTGEAVSIRSVVE